LPAFLIETCSPVKSMKRLSNTFLPNSSIGNAGI
jgi:hypothetical protein